MSNNDSRLGRGRNIGSIKLPPEFDYCQYGSPRRVLQHNLPFADTAALFEIGR
jgi:hypothetical protein